MSSTRFAQMPREALAWRAIALCCSLFAINCGRDSWSDVLWGPSTVTRQSPPSPSPSVPAEEPTPVPTASATPPADDPQPNRQPVVRVGARVYFVECQGQIVSGWDSTEAAVGCRLHMDCTPRDAADQPTQATGAPSWHLSDPGLVLGGDRNSYTPAFTVARPGRLSLYVEIDGVRSNTLDVRLF
jgi:hypothetical protein